MATGLGASVQFSNSGSGDPRLYISTESGYGFCAVLLPKSSPYIKPTIDLVTSWSQTGSIYLFVRSAPKDISVYIPKLRAYLKQITSKYSSYMQVACAWIFETDSVSFSDSNLILLPFQKVDDKKSSVIQPHNISLGNQFATLYISAGADVEPPSATSSAITISKGNTGDNFSFSSNHIASATISRSDMTIDFSGPARGSFQYEIGLNYGTDINAFDLGLKFFRHTPNEQSAIEQHYPVFIEGGQNDYLLAQLAIDPLNVLNKGALRSYIALLGETYDNTSHKTISTILPSFYRTQYGLTIDLTPIVDVADHGVGKKIPSDISALFVFSRRKAVGGDQRYYLVPKGHFQISADGSSKTELSYVLCGLSGTENISVTPQVGSAGIEGDILCFYDKQPAYAALFPIVNDFDSPTPGTDMKPKLVADYLTSWIGIIKPETKASAYNITYHAQPNGSSLYAPDQGISKSFSNVLGYFPAKSGEISHPKAGMIQFPMVPYAGVEASSEAELIAVHDYEAQILNPFRKEQIYEALHPIQKKLEQSRKSTRAAIKQELSETKNPKDKKPPVDDGVIKSTSPQGLLNHVCTETAVWDLLKLASNELKILVAGKETLETYDLQFEDLCARLQSAFQTNQQFLVISFNKDDILGKFSNEMSLMGWPFVIDVPTESQNVSGDYKNVLIFKFCKGTLLERVQNTKLWTNPADFNDVSNNGLFNVALWTQNYIQDGIDQFNAGNQDFTKFNKVATDPNWNGVIALKTDISLKDFPEDLQGLLAGIDLSHFNAHHFGVDTNRIKVTDGQLAMDKQSSMFGFINYVDPAFKPYDNDVELYRANASINTSVKYDYKVLNLKVLFDNSKIKSFNSHIQITINELFGESVKSGNRQNLLILNGSYENHNGTPTYIFNEKDDNALYMNSAVLNRVEIVKAAFTTILPKSANNFDPNAIHTRFSFWGFLNFNALKGIDLFSFGSNLVDGAPGPDSNQGLSFSNLYIDLDFNLKDPTTKNFSFDVEQIAFSIGQSTSREQSLYPHFPLKLKSLISGDDKNTPSDLGFLNVLLPDLKQQQAVSGQWYGLDFDINLGSVGALAGEMGFTSSLMLAWTVGGTGAAAGLKLPGVNTHSKFLSLEGVLKLDIATIQLNGAETKDHRHAYLMKFNKISLSILSLKLPPSATIDFYLFGNPNKGATPSSMGWYAAYQKKK